MLDTKTRGYVQKGFDFIAVYSFLVKLSPNMITVIAFIVGLAAFVALSFKVFWVALALLWLSGLLDVLDGTVARITNKSSPLGAYLDMIFDRMVEAFIIIGFYLIAPQYGLIYLLFMASVLFNFTSFMLAGNLFKNTGVKSMHYDIGLVERTETFIIFSLMILFPVYQAYILLFFTILVVITGVYRMFKIVQYIKKQELHYES